MAAPPQKPDRPRAKDAQSAVDPADEVIVHLSQRDRDIVLSTIEEDLQPNQALRSLAKRYRDRYE